MTAEEIKAEARNEAEKALKAVVRNVGAPLSFNEFLRWGKLMTKGGTGKKASEIKKDLAAAGFDVSRVDDYFRQMDSMLKTGY